MHRVAWILFGKRTVGCLVPLAAYFITGIQILVLLVMTAGFVWCTSMMSLVSFYYWRFKVRKVLSVYTWEYRAPVWKYVRRYTKSQIVVVRLGQQGHRWAPEVMARNPLGATRWDKEMESGVWFAGDLPFGGVIAKPGGEEPMLIQLRTWDEMSSEREAADASRIDLAQRANIHKRAF